jgi:putative ABC transport system substrate-binding protein
MDRRTFVSSVACGIFGVALSPVIRAQTTTKMRRIGFLSTAERPSEAEIQKDWAPLRQLGWIEGTNYVVEWKYAASRDALPAAAQQLVRLKVDLIVTDGTPATLAAKEATTTIPIVISSAGDPVATGLVASLAHPGGNITGYSLVTTELMVKRAALLHELLPTVQRVALPVTPDNPISRLIVKQAEAAYRSLGVRVILIDPEKVASFLAEAARQGAQAVDEPFVGLGTDVPVFVERAMHYRLPVMSMGRQVVDAGGLISFDIDPDENRQRVAVIIDKVLRGAKPADIPIEQPTRFKLIINLKSAKALGITVPQSLLLRADELIR